MIAASDAVAVAGAFEVIFDPSRRPAPEVDPGDTVRLPVLERTIRLFPMAHA